MRRKYLLIFISILFSTHLFSQGTDASISGKVKEASTVIAGASIEIFNTSTGFKSTILSDKFGQFRFVQIPLGGPYVIKATHIGFAKFQQEGIFINQGDNVTIDALLQKENGVLQEVMVVAKSTFRNRDSRLGTTTSINSKEIQRLPAANRNFTNLAQLSPLVGSSMNIGGFNSRNNAITIDGVTAKESYFGQADEMPYTLSLEALREFEVVSNVYDVTEGRSAAGAIKAVTKSGTNQFQGSVFSYFLDDRLAASKDLLGRSVINDTKIQRGFSLSGPIIKNKLHFVVSYDGERLEQAYDLWAKSIKTGVVQNNAGHTTTQENIDRAIKILQDKYLVSKTQQIGFFTRKNKLDTWFGKLDWQLSQKHKLTFRYTNSDFIRPNNSNSDIGNYGIHDAGYDFIVKGKNALLALRSQFNSNVSNELKIGYYYNTRENAINTAAHPQLWLNMQATIDGTAQNAVLVGRYNRWTPEVQRNNVVTLNDDVYFNKNGYQFIIGTQNTLTKTSGIYTHDIKGRFDFSTIDALDALRPDRFRRKFTNPGQELDDLVVSDFLEVAVYAQATKEIINGMKMTAGLRYDIGLFMNAPDYNELLFKELGYKNNVKPIDANNIQPRFNFSWNINEKNKDFIDAGFGWFIGQMITRPHLYSLVDNGIRFTGIDITGKDGYIVDPSTGNHLIKNGEKVPMPVPNYAGYAKDPSTIPGTGYTNTELFGAGNQAQVVRFVDDKLQMPNSFKAHISYHRYLLNWLRVGVSGYLISTKNMLVMENVNLKRDIGFALEGEGGRQIYTPLSKMKSSSADITAAKISNQFNEAVRFSNGTKNSFKSIVFDVSAKLPHEGSVAISYTRAEAKGAEKYRNESDERFVGANYFDNFQFINDGYSGVDFRQKVLINITSPKVGGFTVGAYLTMVETGRFSAIITRGDVAGAAITDNNGYAAFIFDPNSASTLQFQGQRFVDDLKYVFENAGPAAKKYLNENVGKYAQVYGGLNGWQTSLNLRLSNDIKIYKTHNLGLTIDCFNFLNLLNKEWGGYWNHPYQELYKVKSFNASTKSYAYEINRNYGQRRKEGNGFVLMLGLRYSF